LCHGTWVDTHLAVDHVECDPGSGGNYTSGRDEDGGELELPALNTDRRIDYIFMVPPRDGFECSLVRPDLLGFGPLWKPGEPVVQSHRRRRIGRRPRQHDPACQRLENR
jgi:hypothetical protein